MTPPSHSRCGTRALTSAGTALLFLLTILGANYLTARYGMIGVGFGMTVTAGTWLAGLSLTARDLLHDQAGRAAVLAAVAAGTGASALLASPGLALASAAAFGVSELIDLAVYTPLRRRGWARAVLASNLAGALADTAVFLTVAGFPIMASLGGQMYAKTAATLGVIIPVVVCRAVLRHRVRATRP